MLKLAPEIERSADLCCNICKAARRIYGHDLDPKLRGLIQKMSDQAQQEYKESVEAYVAVDGVRSAALPDMDGLLDDMHRQFIAQILESHAGGTIDLQVAVQLAVVARFYERLGDHAVNIGQPDPVHRDRCPAGARGGPGHSRGRAGAVDARLGSRMTLALVLALVAVAAVGAGWAFDRSRGVAHTESSAQ